MAAEDSQEKVPFKEVQLVIFRLADEEFGIDISQIKEIIRVQSITPMPKAPGFIEGIINLRGQIIAVMDLAKKFGLSMLKKTEKTRIIITEVKGHAMGLMVDEVPEVLRISVEDIEPTPQMLETQVHTDFIKGVGKFTDRLIILLDVDKILSHDEAKQAAEAGQG